MWVNAETGEVSLKNPTPIIEENLISSNQRRRRMAVKRDPWHKVLRRDSSLTTYKNRIPLASPSCSCQEVEELFDMLDPRSNLKLLLMSQ